MPAFEHACEMGAREPLLNQASCGSRGADHGQKHHPDAGKPLAWPGAHAAANSVIRDIGPALALLRFMTSRETPAFQSRERSNRLAFDIVPKPG